MFKILLLMAMMLAFPAFAADVSQPVDDVLKVGKPTTVDTVIPVWDPRTKIITAYCMGSGHERSYSVTGEITQHDANLKAYNVLATTYHLPFEVAWRS